MMTLHYTSGTVLMADDVCEALLRYAQALAATQASDVVTVPIIDGDQADAMAEFLLGPSSQLFATPVPGDAIDPPNDVAVQDLERRTRATVSTAVLDESDESPGWDMELEYRDPDS